MPPAAPRPEPTIVLLFMVAALAFFAWAILQGRRNQKANLARVDQAMAQNRANAEMQRESLELARRSLEVAEARLAAQDETNRLLERLVEASRRDRP